MSQSNFKPLKKIKPKDAPIKFDMIPKIFENHILPKGDKKKINIQIQKIDNKIKLNDLG